MPRHYTFWSLSCLIISVTFNWQVWRAQDQYSRVTFRLSEPFYIHHWTQCFFSFVTPFIHVARYQFSVSRQWKAGRHNSRKLPDEGGYRSRVLLCSLGIHISSIPFFSDSIGVWRWSRQSVWLTEVGKACQTQADRQRIGEERIKETVCRFTSPLFTILLFFKSFWLAGMCVRTHTHRQTHT